MKRAIIKIMIVCYLYALVPIAGYCQNFVDATNDANIVPIELLNFKAALLGSNIEVSWNTASETNNSHFNVLRSVNGKDFSSIGKVNGKGTTSSISNYSFMDASFPKQHLYYQLEQVDMDGKKTLSAVVLVKFTSGVQLSIFPNPVKDKKFSITLGNIAETDYTVTVLNAAGITIYSKQWKAISNVPLSIQLPQQFQAGIYLLQVQDKTSTLKLAKQLLIY